MIDYQRIVEFLRDFRTSPVQTVTDEVREAAAAYAQLCAAANDRLRQCAMLLQRGLRAEAVHQAETSPNLLDLVAALDLPDPEGWAELCQRADLPVPPALQIERAAQLNDAYGQDQPLAQLYATHRRLALSHGPLVQRLGVMRQLAQAEPSSFWEKDLRAFEHARFKQLRVAFTSAVARKDVAGITSLATEVLDSPWIEPPPQDLAAAAKDVNDRVRHAQFGADLANIMARLRTAFEARSLRECAGILSEIRELSTLHDGSSIPEAAAIEIRTVSSWVQQEQQLAAGRQAFAAGCDALSQALDADARNGQLEAAYRSITALGQPLPPDLAARYDGALRRRVRMVRIRYAAIFVGIAAIAGVALVVLNQRNQATMSDEWARKIDEAATKKDVALAKQLIAEQEQKAPEFNAAPNITAAKKAVSVLVDQLNKDKQSLVVALTGLDQATKAATAAGTDDAEPQALLAAASAADDAINQAKARIAGPDAGRFDPTKQIAGAIAKLTEQRDDLRRRAETWVMARADAASRKAEAITVSPQAASIAAAEQNIAAADKELELIRPHLDRGGLAEAKTVADGAAARLARMREAVRQARAELDARQALPTAATSAANARAALQDFARKFPASPLAADFTTAAAATEPYEAIEQWHLLAGPMAADPAVVNEKTILQRLEAVRGYARDYPASPMVARSVSYADYLEQAAAAIGPQNTWQVAMNEVLSSPLLADLKYVQTSDNARYYVLGEFKVQKQEANDRVRYAFDVLDPQNLTRRRTIVLTPPQRLVTDKPLPAPHTAYVHTMVEQLKSVDPATWDTWGIDLVARIAAEDKLDPVVKGIILREALQATAKADGWAVGTLYDRVISDLVRQRLDQIVWYDPEHPVPEVTLAALRAIFARVPKADDAKKMVTAKKAEMFKSLRPTFGAYGILLRDETGKWQIATTGSKAWDTAVILQPAPGAAPSAAPTPPAPAPVPTPPGTAPATQPASGPAAAPPAPVLTPALPPAVPAMLVVVAKRQGDVMVVDENVARNLPQGSLVLFTRQ